MSNPVLAKAIGTPDGVTTEFNTPSAYYPGTVFLYLNGNLVDPNDDDGIIELGGNTVKHKISPRVNDIIHYHYHESPPTGGAIQQPPDMIQSFELLPDIYAIIDLRPVIIDAEDQTVEEEMPQMVGNEHLSPEIASVVDLCPEIISAEGV